MANTVKRVKYPNWLETTMCTLMIESEGVTEDGEPKPVKTVTTKCIYNEHSKRVIDKDGKTVMLTGKVYKNGDIAPELALIGGGKVRINGAEFEIHAVSRPRNPDGTVHHTEIDLK